MHIDTEMRPEADAAKEALRGFFSPDKIETAVAILLCLFNRDPLPKEEYAGVRVQEVQDAASSLGLKIE